MSEFHDKGINWRTRWDDEEPFHTELRCRDTLLGLPEVLCVQACQMRQKNAKTSTVTRSQPLGGSCRHDESEERAETLI